MDYLHLLVLAVVQGITEFLPISSSAHLILIPEIFGWRDQGLMIDVALHVGTLAAVVTYFSRESLRMAGGAISLAGGRYDGSARLLLLIVVATVPVVVAGFALREVVSLHLRSATVIAATTIGFGILLYVADRWGRRQSVVEGMTWQHAFLIGLVQCLALVPGTSRAGVTMTAALFLGYQRVEAARFSLLLSIPTTAAAGVLIAWELWQSGDFALQGDALLGAAFAFVAAWLAIGAMMAWLRRSSFTPFVVYRLLLGVALLLWLYL
ncbi:MAG TPA: undecaprenyl-diphosphate phosphatase [Kiloniellales bacterium]|nr:undecaprenyl-diphosphate phosphatase [Kiloniellales bacterium]